MVYRRNLNLKAKVESTMSHFSFKCLVPGGFNVGLIGATCTAPPWRARTPRGARAAAPPPHWARQKLLLTSKVISFHNLKEGML
jgi:hypothetical protein